MKLNAYTRTINDILTLNRIYRIPRFQREYAWEKEELKSFLYDIIKNIEIKEDIYHTTNYFIGSLVLVGDDTKDTEFDIVDGQQRLTTITILFSVLSAIFKQLNHPNLQESCFTFIEGKDSEFNPFLKLESESPKPFFQHRIQVKEPDLEYIENTDEEKKILFAYNYFHKLLKEKEIVKILKELDKYKTTFNYLEILKSVRDTIKNLQVIYITVDNIDDANTIFETLNAKGKDLETIDLLKNEIFKILKSTHPTDATKTKWKSIKDKLRSRENTEEIGIFLRHFWLAKYGYVQKTNLFKAFKEIVPATITDYNSFLSAIVKSSDTYIKVISPLSIDWKRNEKKIIYKILRSLNDFNVSQTRPLIITLIEKNEANSKILNHKNLVKFLILLENFHFKFTAITSSRASNIESVYSRLAIKIINATNSIEIGTIYNELYTYIQKKVPSYQVYKDHFMQIKYTNDFTRKHKLVRYILLKIEDNYNETNELIIDNFSIEHISNQEINLKTCGLIGNLLPLSQKLNSEIKTNNFTEKINIYKKSEFHSIKYFIDKYHDYNSWNDVDITNRTEDLCELTYNTIFKI